MSISNTSDINLSASLGDVGSASDSVATTDTGSFSVISLIKRGLQNWTTILSRIPSLVSGRVPVDGSGVTQPVSASSLPLPTGAATSSAQATTNTTLSSIDVKIPALVTGRVPVDGSGVTQPVSTPMPASIITTQYKITATATAVGAGVLSNGVIIKARSTNAGTVFIGSSSSLTTTSDGTGNGYTLAPGEAISYATANLSAIFAVGTANDVIYITGN